MAAKWYEFVTGSIEQKKQYRQYRARIKSLHEPYRDAGLALERYLLNLGPTSDGDSMIGMLTDLADLLEQSAAAGTPVRDIVGTDPAEFAETFMENYGGGSWIRSERNRLSKAIDDAEKQQP